MSQQDGVQEGPSTSTDGTTDGTKPVSAIFDGKFYCLSNTGQEGPGGV